MSVCPVRPNGVVLSFHAITVPRIPVRSTFLGRAPTNATLGLQERYNRGKRDAAELIDKYTSPKRN